MSKSSDHGVRIKHRIIDIEMAATAMGHAPDQMARLLSDGRVIFRHVEIWAGELFNFVTHDNSNHPSSDGQTHHSDLPSQVSIKCLKDRVRVQKSVNVGASRKCTKSDLEEAVNSAPYFIIADISCLPRVVFFLLPSKLLKKWIDLGELTPAGLTRKKLFDLILRDATIVSSTLDQRDWSNGHDDSHRKQMTLDLDAKPEPAVEETSAARTLVNMVREVMASGKLRARAVSTPETPANLFGFQKENGDYFAIDLREKNRCHFWSPTPAREGRHGVLKTIGRTSYTKPPQFSDETLPPGAKAPSWFIQFKQPGEAIDFLRSC